MDTVGFAATIPSMLLIVHRLIVADNTVAQSGKTEQRGREQGQKSSEFRVAKCALGQ
jgi:hypothetical protein